MLTRLVTKNFSGGSLRRGRYPLGLLSAFYPSYAIKSILSSHCNKSLALNFSSKRFISGDTITKDLNYGEDDNVENTGVFLKESNESLVYFDHVMAYKVSNYDLLYYILNYVQDMPDDKLRSYIQDLCVNESKKYPLEVTDFKIIRRDGGAFVNFKIPPDTEISEFNKCLMETVKARQEKGFRNFFLRPRVFPVKGVPWIEDLRRYPSTRIKISFEGPDLSQEDLYLLFRRYGPIADINPPAPDSKDNPRIAYITFKKIRSAITARHCVTGLKVDDTILHIQYQKIIKPNAILGFVNQHQRIFIPLFVAMLAGLAVIVFDPIRQFFIREKITEEYSIQKRLQNNEFYKFATGLFTSTRSMLFSGRSGAAEDFSIQSLWSDRVDTTKEISLWLEENANTFIVIQGPRGSGKRSMIQDYVLKDRSNVLYFDCEQILKARKETEVIDSFAQQLGYFPIFAWLGSFSKFLDLIVQGLTGQKSGLSETKESQIKNMLSLTTTVIRDIALTKYNKLAADNCAKNLPIPKEEDYLQQNPDDKPVIVIDRFLAAKKANDTNSFIYKELANWASALIAMNTAHVIFITDDVGSLNVLNESMPGSVFKRSIISDASSEAAERYILEHLSLKERDLTPEKQKLLLDSIRPFGGRMLDLQLYIRRLNSGEDPEQALKGMIYQTLEQLNQVFTSPDKQEGFTSAQAWSIMKLLAEKEEASYKDVYNLPLFKGNTGKLLNAMENAELVSVIKNQGLISAVKPAKPIYKTAFESMVKSSQMYQVLEVDYLNSLIKMETAKIAQYEDELSKCSHLSDGKGFRDRLQYLCDKISASTVNIRAHEKKIVELFKK